MSSFVDLLKKDQKNLLVIPSSLNEGYFNLAKSSGFLYDLSFMSKEEFINNVLGTYSTKGLLHLRDQKNITLNQAMDILKTLPLVGGPLKKEMEPYYTIDSGFISYLSHLNLLVFPALKSDFIFDYAINEVKKKGINPSFISLDFNPSHQIILSPYPNILKEVEGTIEKVMKLISDGISPSQIYIEPLDDSYYSIIEDVLSFYHLPCSILLKKSYMEMEDVIYFYDFLKSNKLEPSIDQLNLFLKDHPMNKEIEEGLKDIISKMEIKDIELFDYLLSNTKKQIKKYRGCVQIGSFFNTYLPKDSYFFLLGFNQGVFPKIIRPTGDITDEELKELNLPSSKQLNTANEEYIIARFREFSHVFISYKIRGIDKDYSPSSLILKMKDIKKETPEIGQIRYSVSRDNITFKKAKDIYDTYDDMTTDYEEFFLLGNTTFNLPYDSSFNLKDGDLLDSYMHKTYPISYSAIDNFYDCPYKYYLNYILKLDPFRVTFSTFIGSFFHEYIEKYLMEEYSETSANLCFENFEKEEKEKNGFALSYDERFYMNLFLENLRDIHDELRKFHESSSFKPYFKEKNFQIEENQNGIKVIKKGTIDLILKDKDNHLAIIDYKTGLIPTIDLENGKKMQLYIYANLLAESLGDEYSIFGMFYEPIPSKPIDYQKMDLRYKKPQIQGALSSLVHSFDPYDIKEVNKGIIDEKTFNDNLSLVKTKVDEAIKVILNHGFKITPSIDSCQYCPFNDICYKFQAKEEDLSDEGD